MAKRKLKFGGTPPPTTPATTPAHAAWAGLPRVILMLSTEIAFGRDLALGIGMYARTHGRWRFVTGANTRGLPIPHAVGYDAEAAIVSLTEKFDLAGLNKSGLPAVNISGQLLKMPIPSVITDDAAIGKMAADHFVDRGFRNFAFVGVGTFGFSIRRGDAFITALRASSSTRHVSRYDIHYTPDWKHERQQQELSTWLAALPKPVAVFVCSDSHAAHVADACHRCGVVVPEEVGILGVDNDTAVCEFVDPPLSSIDANTQQLGYEAASMLHCLMQGKKLEQRVRTIEPRGVIVRHSSDSLAIGDADVAAAVRFIRENAHRGVDVEQVLEQVPMNRRMMERRFRRALDRTPAAEIRRCRIELAKKLLADTDRSMSEIARACGFLYPQHLASAFNQLTGMTPTDYRQRTGPLRTHLAAKSGLPGPATEQLQ